MKSALVAAICLSVIMAFFAVQNAQPTQVSFFGWYFTGPLVIVLLATFAGGALTAILAALPGIWRKAAEIARLKKLLETATAAERQREAAKADANETAMPSP